MTNSPASQGRHCMDRRSIGAITRTVRCRVVPCRKSVGRHADEARFDPGRGFLPL